MSTLPPLTPDEEQTLLRIAREAIENCLRGNSWTPEAGQVSEPLRRPAGAFVTLRIEGELRGCIGTIQPVSPLFKAVAENAVRAAFRDPRFFPLTEAEWKHVDIEISVLGPIEDVADYEEIMVGRDGLIVRSGSRAGLLLPQVATDYHWDRSTFLSQTCVKAGLDPDAWRRTGCRVERFGAHVFAEMPATK